MRRAGILLLVLGALLAGAPVVSAAPHTDRRSDGSEDRALALLAAAARASATLSWSGTQYASSWRGGSSTSAVVEVSHAPGVGVSVQAGPGERVVVPSAVVDERLLAVLASEYDLVVGPGEQCSGRPAQVVEARRGGAVAGRFWLDEATGLVLRREVYNPDGSRLRSTAFVALVVDSDSRASVRAAVASLVPGQRRAQRAGERLDATALREQSWIPAGTLPGGYALVDARTKDHDGTAVVQLVWSDGLSTQSLFAQPGSLSGPPGEDYLEQRVGDATVWTTRDGPQRAIWSGSGHVFTLVSDAPTVDVGDMVAAMPHDRAAGTGVTSRLGRGLGRIGSWLNPFA